MKEAVACYKSFRHEISSSVPFYPLGLPHFHDDFLCLAFRMTGGVRMAVWRMGERDTVHIPVSAGKGNAHVIYPKGSDCVLTASTRGVTVTLPRPHTAVLIELH